MKVMLEKIGQGNSDMFDAWLENLMNEKVVAGFLTLRKTRSGEMSAMSAVPVTGRAWLNITRLLLFFLRFWVLRCAFRYEIAPPMCGRFCFLEGKYELCGLFEPVCDGLIPLQMPLDVYCVVSRSV